MESSKETEEPLEYNEESSLEAQQAASAPQISSPPLSPAPPLTSLLLHTRTTPGDQPSMTPKTTPLPLSKRRRRTATSPFQ
jgi:hypothetical protein